jgi:hypothetical protein
VTTNNYGKIIGDGWAEKQQAQQHPTSQVSMYNYNKQ